MLLTTPRRTGGRHHMAEVKRNREDDLDARMQTGIPSDSLTATTTEQRAWHLDPKSPRFVVDASGTVIAEVFNARLVREPNAFLIAAAPDLLNALKWAERQLRALVTEDDGTGVFIRGTGTEVAGFGAGVEMIRSALAKAAGAAS